MATRSQRLTAEQWKSLVNEQGISGLSREAFCKARNINKHTFCYWKSKLSADVPAISAAMPDFIEIKRPQPASEASAWDLELTLSKGITLRLRIS